MRKLCVAFALCLMTTGASALELSNDKFTVTTPGLTPSLGQTNPTLAIVGDDLVYGVNFLVNSGAVTTRIATFYDFTFTPQAGYQISGYDISYAVRVAVPFCVQPYPECVEGGVSISGTYGPEYLSWSGVTFAGHLFAHVDGPALGAGSITVIANAGVVCSTIFSCGSRFTFGAVDTMTITPILTAVPEPSTYLLLIGGLLGIVMRQHRRAPLPRTAGTGS